MITVHVNQISYFSVFSWTLTSYDKSFTSKDNKININMELLEDRSRILASNSSSEVVLKLCTCDVTDVTHT